MIKVEIANNGFQDRLAKLLKRASVPPRSVFLAIGESISESTKIRFREGKAPDGTPWAPNSPTTIKLYLQGKSGLFDKITGKRVGTKKGYFRKDGKAAQLLAAKKPLRGLTGLLADQIYYNVVSDGVEVGSPMIYSAMQQFGGTKRQFPHLWGDIPARPFLGISHFDERGILDILQEFLEE